MTTLTRTQDLWISVQNPEEVDAAATVAFYVGYPYALGIPTPAGWDWLAERPEWPTHMGNCDSGALSSPALAECPKDIREFFERGLWTRLRTFSFVQFDLGQEFREGLGGRLLALMRDHQDMLYWALLVLPDGTSRIVASPYPLGRDVDDERITEAPWCCVADSFTDFVFRWWHSNEIVAHHYPDEMADDEDLDDDDEDDLEDDEDLDEVHEAFADRWTELGPGMPLGEAKPYDPAA